MCALQAVNLAKDIGYAHCEVAENCRYFVIRQPKADFIERYKNGDQCIALRRVEPLAGNETAQDGLVFQAFDGSFATHDHVATQHEITASSWLSQNQPLMLTSNVEAMEGPKGCIPSLVWFEQFDRGALPRGKPLFAFDASDGIEKIVEGSVDWKVRVATRIGAVPRGQSRSEQVQTAPQRSDDCSDPRVEGEWKRLIVDYRRVASAVRVRLYDDRIGIGALPIDEPLLQQWDLGFGPLQSCMGV